MRCFWRLSCYNSRVCSCVEIEKPNTQLGPLQKIFAEPCITAVTWLISLLRKCGVTLPGHENSSVQNFFHSSSSRRTCEMSCTHFTRRLAYLHFLWHIADKFIVHYKRFSTGTKGCNYMLCTGSVLDLP